MKLLEENVGETLQGVGVGDDFLDKIPKAQLTETNIEAKSNSRTFAQQRKCSRVRYIQQNWKKYLRTA